MKIRGVLAALLLLAAGSRADAATITSPFLTGPQDPSQITGTVNSLVIAINAILSPLTGPTVVGGVNSVGHLTAITGSPAVINLQPGADTNAGIQIVPNGSGSLTLMGLSNTGFVQFGNQGSFVSAPGLAPYPGQLPWLAALQGVHTTAQGTLLIKDWLGYTRGIPVY